LSRRVLYFTLSLILSGCLFNSDLYGGPADTLLNEASNTRIRAEELSRRREQALFKMGPGLMILFSNEPKNFSHDVYYPFRQENNLYYLTGINQAGITLVLLPENYDQRAILFLPKRDPSREVWTGHMLSHEEAQRMSNISHIWDAYEFEPFLNAVLRGKTYDKRQADDDRDYQALSKAVAGDHADVWLMGNQSSEMAEYPLAHAFKNTLSRFPGVHPKDTMPIFTDLRIAKSAYEIKQLRRAIDITSESHRNVMRAVAQHRRPPGLNESVLDGIILSTYRQHGAHWGFPSIVASGPNATTLHYEENNREIIHENELVLLDIGASVDHYSADVTRTIPVSGTFTTDQRAIYEIVLKAQETAISAVKPGLSIRKIHTIARDIIKDGLKDLGLITQMDGKQYRLWFMHGTSHWIGLDVHDVGGRDTPFEPGMVLTVEPGIYIREDALDYLEDTPENQALIEAIQPTFERYKNIGIRIEDDVLVTPEGYELLSGSAPRTIEDIETYMAKHRPE
jgi:Xaa-Pro aminopeptidase